MDKSISINKSKVIKVLAVFMMVFLHIFGHPNRIENVSYETLFIIAGIPVEQLLTYFMGICVSIFLFLSGYGLYQKYGKEFKLKNALTTVKGLYKIYLVIFIIFVGIGHLIGKYQFNFKELILNLLTISSSYNGEWWFLNLYILLIITYPLGCKLIEKLSLKQSLLVILVVNILGMMLIKGSLMLGISNIILNLFSTLLSRQVMFYLGVLVAKYGIFDKWIEKLKFSKASSYIILCVVTALLIFKIDLPIIDQFIYMALEFAFIFMLVIIVSEKSVLLRLAKHTTNIWLIHSFFCYHLFQELPFYPKY
ncbi:MAG: acyltransferase family protein [Sarcina sp.]